ncbi:uncharacterized protein LOC104685169 isoform X1 [Corvus cornix cornix]|uniref:uncharacterized protein LOC104685169 isoform X1 n=2 Tax=Corvus cornix cornix TaxID=932674 RepID=UPI00194FD278|nr:uncharacterized protein LOC104685169 isoform X1 [Corvus cornix cornix]
MAPQGRNWLNFAPLVPQICLWPLTRDEAEQGKAGSSFQLGQVVPGTESMKNPEVVQGQAASPCATANLQHPFLPTRRAVWPQQQHRTPVLAPARASSLGIEEAKTPQEAMGEPLRAVVMKIFGGPDETCEVAEGIAQLYRLIGLLEARCLPPDAGNILNSWSEMRLHLPSGLPKDLERSLSSCCCQSDALWEALERFRDMDPLMGLHIEKKTLETGTTLPQLLAERKSVRWNEEEEQDEVREPR